MDKILLIEGQTENRAIASLLLARRLQGGDRAKNIDPIRVHENLRAGSVNHMKAFYSQWKTAGGDYSPKLISAELFNQITSEPAGKAT